MRLALVEIINQIKQSNWNPDVVISVNRGGCIPGVYLSHILNIPHYAKATRRLGAGCGLSVSWKGACQYE